jgi:hypothetical protein
MKVKKVDDVSFAVQLMDGDVDVSLKWKDGQLYLALSGLLIGSGDKIYEIPIKDVESIDVVDEKPIKIRFSLKDLTVTLSGKSPEQLHAVRHLLLPLISA